MKAPKLPKTIVRSSSLVTVTLITALTNFGQASTAPANVNDGAPNPNSVIIPNAPVPHAHLAELERFNRAFDQSPHSFERDVQILSMTEDAKVESSLLVKNCRVETLQLNAFDPITSKQGGLRLRLYTPTQTQGILRQILLMPPTGGENALDLGYADSFCSNGFQTAILEKWDGDDLKSLNLGMHDVGSIRVVAAMRHAIEFLNPDGRHPLALFGTSVGAISSALVMGFESRIQSAILIVGGVGMSEIIANSHEQTLSLLRTQRMAQFGYPNIATYQQALAGTIEIDPSDQIIETKVKAVQMFIADQDITVPTANQIQLRDRLVSAGVAVSEIHYNTNHIGTIKKTFFSLENRRLMLSHLNSTLGAQP